MTQHAYVRPAGDNDLIVLPSGAVPSMRTDDVDTTDDEFMQLVAQVHAEAEVAFVENLHPLEQEESA